MPDEQPEMAMPDGEFSDPDAIRRLARELSFADDPELLEECLAAAESLYEDLDTDGVFPSPGEDRGRPGDDPYNAMLSVYETPRTETADGPLDDLTVGIKDNLAVADLPMTGGLAEHTYVPSYDAVVVERLLDAGAAIHGKTNMDALGLGPEGVWSEIAQVRNSIDDERVPGGSSSGSAVAVATGQVDAALGTDAGGSVRKPAAYNELVGIKPTQGIVPAHGKITSATTLGSIGPITRSVADAARVLEVIAGPDRRAPGAAQVDVGPLADGLDEPLACEIGLPDTFLECADPGVEAVIRRLADEIEDATDCTVTPVELDNTVSSLPSYLSGPEMGWLIRQETVDHGAGTPTDPAWYHLFQSLTDEGFNDHITRRKLPGAYVDDQTDGLAYVVAYLKMLAFREELATLFEDVPLLLSPTVPAVPPRLDEDIEHLPRNLSINCQPFNLSGSPAVAVPADRVDGLPVSAQIAAPAYEDDLALRGAQLIERIAG